MTMVSRYSLLDDLKLFVVAKKLRVIQSNEMGFPSRVGDPCWSGLKSFTAKEEKIGCTLRKTLFILKRKDGLREFAVFDSTFIHFRDADRKYVFEIASKPIVLRDQDMMVHLMSRKEIRLAVVELVENLGSNPDFLVLGCASSHYLLLPSDPSCPSPVLQSPALRRNGSSAAGCI